jgi:protein-L-isoaspartate(D-aspartate) O-methyltransferase
MNETDYSRLRNEMVINQLIERGIKNQNVLAAFFKVRRHVFIPPENRIYSYEDGPVPIGFDQTISQPYIVAFMISLLKPDTGMRVLEIGTGSGYQTAILSCLCNEVFTVETNETLSKRAAKTLKEEGYSNIKLKTGDGYKGWMKFAPYDIIIVSCAPHDIPLALKQQLAEKGRLVLPAGELHNQKLYLIEKINGEIKETESIRVKFVPMIPE